MTDSGADRTTTSSPTAVVNDPEQVGAAFDALQRQWGRLDLLVNNAGVFGPTVPLELVTPRTGTRCWQ